MIQGTWNKRARAGPGGEYIYIWRERKIFAHAPNTRSRLEDEILISTLGFVLQQ